MDKEQLYESGLLEMYVLGLTSEEENAQVAELAAQHPDVQKEIDTMRKALENYAMSHSIPPPPGLRDKVMSAVDREEDTPDPEQAPVRSQPPARRWVSLAAGFILLASCIYFFQQHRRSEGRLTALKKDYVSLERNCTQEKQQLRSAQQALAFLQKEHTQPLVLRGSELAPSAFATVYWNEEEEIAWVCMNGMPEPPEGKQYQAWADVEGEMINMGTVNARSSEAFQSLAYIPEAESVNITLEPEGGSRKPTVALLYANAVIPRERQ